MHGVVAYVHLFGSSMLYLKHELKGKSVYTKSRKKCVVGCVSFCLNAGNKPLSTFSKKWIMACIIILEVSIWMWVKCSQEKVYMVITWCSGVLQRVLKAVMFTKITHPAPSTANPYCLHQTGHLCVACTNFWPFHSVIQAPCSPDYTENLIRLSLSCFRHISQSI